MRSRPELSQLWNMSSQRWGNTYLSSRAFKNLQWQGEAFKKAPTSHTYPGSEETHKNMRLIKVDPGYNSEQTKRSVEHATMFLVGVDHSIAVQSYDRLLAVKRTRHLQSMIYICQLQSCAGRTGDCIGSSCIILYRFPAAAVKYRLPSQMQQRIQNHGKRSSTLLDPTEEV